MSSRLLAAVCLLIAWQLPSAFSQSITGDILGTIKDPTGAVIGGGTITLTDVGTGSKWTVSSDDSGSYLFAQLKPGRYRLETSKAGFQVAVVSDIELQVGQRPRVDVTLQLGEVGQRIEVNAGGVQLLDSQTSSTGQVISQQPIVELPLNGRNFMQLAVLAPAVAPPAPTGSGSPASFFTGSKPGQVSIVVAGMRESNVSYLMNGIETRNPKFGSVGLRPSVDAVQEFKMQTSNFSAEIGRSSAVINTTMKSGTNQFHGSLFEFVRNSHLDSNDFFLNSAGKPIPPYQQNNFGGSFGGPVRIPRLYNGRDKTFFFFGYEGFRSRQGISGNALVPSSAQLAGHLSDDSAGTGIYPTNSPFCQANRGSSKCQDVVDSLTTLPFPNNDISARLDPVAQKWLPYFILPNVSINPGLPTRPGFNATASPKERNDFDQFDFRLDHRLSSKDQLYGSYSNDDRPHFIPAVMPLQGRTLPLKDQLLTITEVHLFAPTVVNELRTGYNRSLTDLLSEGAFGNLNYAASIFGFKNTSTRPLDFGLPRASIPGFTSPGSGFPNPNHSQDQVYQWVDNLSIVTGNHNVKLGFNYIHEKYIDVVQVNAIPTFTFDGRFTNSGLADFLLGLPIRAVASVGDASQDLRSNFYAGYVQDDWRVRPSLTLNLGLRYEYQQAPFSTSSKTSFFDPSIGQVVSSRSGAVRNGIVDPDFNNFGPRVGLAFSPAFLKNTVIRSSFGVFYATDNWNELQFLVVSPEYYVTQTLNSDPTRPTLSLRDMFPAAALGGSNLTPFSLDKRNRTPYVQEWAFDVQRTFRGDLLLDVGYIADTGQKLPQRRNLNIARPDPTGTIPIQNRVPYPNVNYVLLGYNGGWSSYNGLTVKVEKRFSAGSYFLGAYTWSHALDLGTTDEFSASSASFKLYDKGSSLADVRQRAVFSYLYELPFGRGKHLLAQSTGVVHKLAEGWKLNGITTFSSGEHRTAALPFDWPNLGQFSQSRPDQIGNPNPQHRVFDSWLNASAFVAPGCPSIQPCSQGVHIQGNAGRNSLIMPGINNWDFSIIKDTTVTERSRIQFRAEFFNGWNHTQFGDASTSLVPGSFGRITSLRTPPRDIQFGLKYLF